MCNLHPRTIAHEPIFTESLYSKIEPMASCAKEVMSEIVMLSWASSGHSGAYVPVYAVGAGSSLFMGKMDNTDIPRRIARAAGYSEDSVVY